MSRDAKQRKLRRHRERDFREKRASRAWEQPKASARPSQAFGLVSYNITHEPLHTDGEGARRIHDELGDDAMDELFAQAQEQPLTAIPPLQELIEREPDVPMLYNWLSVAHRSAGHDAEAREANRLNFERHPSYIFAIVNVCNDLMDDGQIERVTQILDKKFDLKVRYPDRDEFHVTEFISNSYMVAKYFLLIGEVHAAEIMLKGMDGIAPDHPMTRAIRHSLFIKKGLQIFFPWTRKKQADYCSRL